MFRKNIRSLIKHFILLELCKKSLK